MRQRAPFRSAWQHGYSDGKHGLGHNGRVALRTPRDCEQYWAGWQAGKRDASIWVEKQEEVLLLRKAPGREDWRGRRTLYLAETERLG